MKRFRTTLSLVLGFMCFVQCHTEPGSPALFSKLSPVESGIAFVNTVVPNDSMNIVEFNYFYNGGGVAIGDINNDRLPDIFFSGNQVSSRLYLNLGGMRFKDITASSGIRSDVWASGVSMADVNGDGFTDIYLCASGYADPSRRANKFYLNNGDSTFTESAEAYGIADRGYTSQAAFFDYDRDNDLDLYLLTVHQDNDNPNIPRRLVKDGSSPSTDRLYRNNGDGTFSNVSRQAGIDIEGYGLGITVTDINHDGWPDIYVTNDFIYNDILYVNNGDGTFSDKAAEFFKHTSQFAMGNDAADFNNDGLTDLVSVDMLPSDNRGQKLMNLAMNYDYYMYGIRKGILPQYARNTLQMNNGNGTFSEIGQLAGIYKTNWSWAPLFFDANNDGWKDLFITNGIPKDIINNDFIKYRDTQMRKDHGGDFKQSLSRMIDELEEIRRPNFFFSNNGDMTFTDQTISWGFEEGTISTGASYADLDLDGDLDVVVSNLNAVAQVYRNDSRAINGNHFLKVRLRGPDGNTSGIGSRLILYSGGMMQTLEQSPVRGFQSSMDDVLHFGLGDKTVIDSLQIFWSGKSQTLVNLKADQELIVDLAHAMNGGKNPKEPGMHPIFSDVSNQYQLNFVHQENDFVDFKIERLLLQKYSQSGPKISSGDVNGDGLDDFCVGGSKGNPGKLFLQQPDGQFVISDLPDKEYEDAGLLLFDADNDGDLDLYVASGGNEFNPFTAAYQHRLYINDGKGEFSRSLTALPEIVISGSCVVAADYDADGDLDLFVGGRIVPGRYPSASPSYILNNEGGRFTNVTRAVCADLMEAGMVTDAVWTDFDNDRRLDLVIVGEWMPVTFFKNHDGILKKVLDPFGETATDGWWNCITPGDFDNDGDLDFVVGNLGVNSKYRADRNAPVSLYAKDMDKNGSIEPFVTYFLDGKEYLTHSLDAVVSQIPAWRKKFTTYESYANATFGEYFTKEDLEGSQILKAYEFRHSFVENHGSGKFLIRPLPLLAQVSTLNDALCSDFDGDGHLDILIVGNNYGIEFVQGQYDASIGLYLRGDGTGGFVPVSATESGFCADGDTRGVATVTARGNRKLIVVTRNSQTLKLFEIKRPESVRTETIARK